MAILNGKYKVKNSKNSYDVIHLETSANQVIFNDGKTFQEKLDSGVLKGDKGDTGLQGLKGDKGDKGDAGKDGLTTSVTVGSTKYTHSNGNITIPAYPTLSSLGAASSSHTHNEYVNQNAFSNVKVGTTTVAADRTTDTIELKAGSNIVLNPDTTNDAITIAVNGLTVTSSEKSTWNNKVDKNNPVMTGDSLSFNRKDGTTVGKNSIAIGSDSIASNENSIAIGTNTNTTGQHSVSIGVLNNATGKESVAIGVSNTSRGQNAVAIGRSCVSSNEYSVATGCWTTADGIASNAFGNGSYTNGWGAMASGIVVKAHGLGQHVFGTYNIPDTNVCGTVGSANYNYSARSNYLMIVGNGTSSNLSNAYTLDWNGNAWYQGNISIDGTPSEDNHVITKKYADEHYSGGGNASQDKIIEITKSLRVTTEWMDTGISGADLETGTYVVQMLINDGTNTKQYSEHYSGMMSWYDKTCNSGDSDEIPLHKAGHASNRRHTYLRTLRGSGHTYLKLQIATTDDFLAESSITFKFRKLI